MSIQRKVRAVEKLFQALDAEIGSFRAQAGYSCVPGCGKCCNKADITASPLEFLPWSFHVFLSGRAEDVLKELQEREDPYCLLYKPFSTLRPDQGSCTDYQYRGLICRLFGYAASRDKFGQLRLATCKLIKEEQSAFYQKASEDIARGMQVPVFSDYYMKLARIDFQLGTRMEPVNRAMQLALEAVLHYYTYRPFPKGYKRSA